MADTTTTNFDLIKPEIDGSVDTWGGKLNGNFDIIDATMKEISDKAEASRIEPSALVFKKYAVSTSVNVSSAAASDWSTAPIDGKSGAVAGEIDFTGSNKFRFERDGYVQITAILAVYINQYGDARSQFRLFNVTDGVAVSYSNAPYARLIAQDPDPGSDVLSAYEARHEFGGEIIAEKEYRIDFIVAGLGGSVSVLWNYGFSTLSAKFNGDGTQTPLIVKYFPEVA